MIQHEEEGMRNYIKKTVNWLHENVKGVIQEEKENPALFEGQLVRVFRTFTNIEPSTPEGQSLLGQHFLSPPQ